MALQKPRSGNAANPKLQAGEKHIPHSRRIFVNRNLKMESVRMIGFDMDHTLAVYRKLPVETLAFETTRDKLIAERGYPESIRSLSYDPELVIRGLVIDKRLGNVLKIDQYNYVVRVYHGTRQLSKTERRRLYRNSRIRLSSHKYMSVDTLFSLPEAALFAQLVDCRESESPWPRRDYAQMYDDVRECIDRAHGDGTIKKRIVADPEHYLVRDPELPQVLEAFRDQGKKLFLLTNSEPHYTHQVMTYLLDGARESCPRWYNYFDVVVVNAGKPGFFRSAEPLRALDPQAVRRAGVDLPEPVQLHEGGGSRAFEKMVGFRGDEILYVGDHTFVDILRAKEQSRWRTAMVIEELEQEIERERDVAPRYCQLDELVAQRHHVLSQIGRLRRRLHLLRREGRNGGTGRETRGVVDPVQELEERLRRLEEQSAQLAVAMRAQREEIESCFNKHWGKLFKCGEINSYFGDQVKDFACVYTSAVRNFLAYPESMYFRSPREIMPHETGLEQG